MSTKPKITGSRKSKRVNVAMTPQLYANLRYLAGNDTSVAEEIRTAIRFYLDHQEDLAGSRRHFTRTFQERIDELEGYLSRLEQRQVRLRREILAYLMTAVYTVAWLARMLLFKAGNQDNPDTRYVHQHWRQGMDAVRRSAKTLFADMNILIQEVFEEEGNGKTQHHT